MVTKVKCVNSACQNYGATKSVASAGVMGMDHRKCAACGGTMVAAERTKPTRKPPSRTPSRRRGGGRRSGKR